MSIAVAGEGQLSRSKCTVWGRRVGIATVVSFSIFFTLYLRWRSNFKDCDVVDDAMRSRFDSALHNATTHKKRASMNRIRIRTRWSLAMSKTQKFDVWLVSVCVSDGWYGVMNIQFIYFWFIVFLFFFSSLLERQLTQSRDTYCSKCVLLNVFTSSSDREAHTRIDIDTVFSGVERPNTKYGFRNCNWKKRREKQ